MYLVNRHPNLKTLIRNALAVSMMVLSLTLSPDLFSEEARHYLPYSDSLKHKFVDDKGYDVFEGEITVSGILFFLFSKDINNKNHVIFAWFVPDEASTHALPNVYEKPIDYITLFHPERALFSAFGEEDSRALLKSNKDTLQYYVTVNLRDFMVGEDCDRISYFSELYSITPDTNRTPPKNTKLPDGC